MLSADFTASRSAVYALGHFDFDGACAGGEGGLVGDCCTTGFNKVGRGLGVRSAVGFSDIGWAVGVVGLGVVGWWRG